MIKVEIISNQSVQEDIIELLEQEIQDIEYTVVPGVQGKGLKAKKLGDTTWPELNFILFTYVTEDKAKMIKAIISKVKEKFPSEGISIFFTQAIDF